MVPPTWFMLLLHFWVGLKSIYAFQMDLRRLFASFRGWTPGTPKDKPTGTHLPQGQGWLKIPSSPRHPIMIKWIIGGRVNRKSSDGKVATTYNIRNIFLLSFATQLLRMDLKSNTPNKLNAFLPCLKTRHCLNCFKHAYLSCIEPAVNNGC